MPFGSLGRSRLGERLLHPRQDGFRHPPVPLCRRMDAVREIQLGDTGDAVQHERNQRHVQLVGQARVDGFEPVDVVGSQVGRQLETEKDRLGAGRREVEDRKAPVP